MLVAVMIAGFGGWAAEPEGLSGTIGAEMAFLPGFSTDLWYDLEWNVDGWSVGSLVEVSVLPAFTASWIGSVDYSFSVFDIGAVVTVDIYPFAFGSFDLSAEAGLLELAQDGFTLSVEAGLLAAIFPNLGLMLGIDMDTSFGIFSLWSEFDFTVPGFGVSVLLGGEVRALDLDLNNGGLTADLGASAFLVPAVDAWMWLDLALALGSVTVSAETDFALTPFGLAQQRLEAEIGFDNVEIYVWIEFTGAGDLSAGIGGTYDFP